ncbi:uncharacterized protein ACNLHF_027021 isoform 1-T2 [Anomaloglossus baeobatrachus]
MAAVIQVESAPDVKKVYPSEDMDFGAREESWRSQLNDVFRHDGGSESRPGEAGLQVEAMRSYTSGEESNTELSDAPISLDRAIGPSNKKYKKKQLDFGKGNTDPPRTRQQSHKDSLQL